MFVRARDTGTHRKTCFRMDSGAEGGSQSAGLFGNLENCRTILNSVLRFKQTLDGARPMGRPGRLWVSEELIEGDTVSALIGLGGTFADQNCAGGRATCRSRSVLFLTTMQSSSETSSKVYDLFVTQWSLSYLTCCIQSALPS